MPRMVSQIGQGNSFSRSADQNAYEATRRWKVLLNTPDENWDVAATVGVNIGDSYSDANPIPCVKVSAAADGESRLVRIVTAEYRSSASAAPASPDPRTQQPTARPALYSMTTSLTEIAAWGGSPVTGGVSQGWVPSVNPVGDLVDGITRLEPVVNINVDQYAATDMSQLLAYTGYVNSDQFTFSSLSIGVHCCMLQSISSNPVVEQFGDSTFRGFKVTFGFAVRSHWTLTREGFRAIGWDMAVPQTGFNIINAGLSRADVDQEALALLHIDNKVFFTEAGEGVLVDRLANKKCRASVAVPAGDRGYLQRPSAQPVALNDDGTPRNPRAFSAAQKVLINRICIQPEMAFGNNFSNFGIRWFA